MDYPTDRVRFKIMAILKARVRVKDRVRVRVVFRVRVKDSESCI